MFKDQIDDTIIELVGAVVNQAITDCCINPATIINRGDRISASRMKDDAIDFIFSDRLDEYVSGFDVSVDKIRSKVSFLMDRRNK